MDYSLLVAQRLKERMKTAIVTAALQEFVKVGVARATVPVIAASAGTSVGNIYKYFANKAALFEATVPPAFVDELRDLLRVRVEALGVEVDVHDLAPSHPYRLATEELLRFALAHRTQILFLLRHAEGTEYEGFTEAVAHDLSRLAQRYSKRAYPKIRMDSSRQRVLDRIYRSFLEQIASVLAEEETEQGVRAAIGSLTVYHLSGLRSFFVASSKRPSGERT